MNYLNQNNNLDLCYKNTCVKTSGTNAKILTTVVSFALILISISALVKASNQ